MRQDEERIALLLDYENLAIGARDMLGISPFDFAPIADALADRGRVVVRRAYADWSYFEEDRRVLTRHHVELIEIPQRMGSRKNAADIKLAVDAMELALERDYLTTFVIGTGDSDFTPLVHKIRELNRRVLGVGVKLSTSHLLPPACDEFLFYENLEGVEALPRRQKDRRRRGFSSSSGTAASSAREGRTGDSRSAAVLPEVTTGSETIAEEAKSLDSLKRLVTRTLVGMQGTGGEMVLASNLKQTILRKDSAFTESDYGFRSMGEMLRYLENEGAIVLSAGIAAGDPAVRLAETGEKDAFALLRRVVTEQEESGNPALLSGLKNNLRKHQPGFAESEFGYGSFLQFCKAARAREILELDWSPDLDDYVLRVRNP